MSALALIDAARAKGLTLATAESCTGGLVAARITDTPGASAVFEHGIVTYSNAAKMTHLGVRAQTLADFGAVSEETVREMAEGLLRVAPQADIAIAISGIAGPGPSDHKPEGMVCFGVATAHDTQCHTQYFGALGRDMVRSKATEFALAQLLDSVTHR